MVNVYNPSMDLLVLGSIGGFLVAGMTVWVLLAAGVQSGGDV